MPDYNLGTASGLIDIDVSSVDAAGRKLTSAGRQMIGFGTALTSGFVLAVKSAADFEKEISAIQAVTASTDEQVNVLRESALELGSKGPFGPTEVAQGFLELAKAGLSAQEVIEGAGTATINLAKAGDLPIARAAEIAANAMRTFGIEAKDVNHIVDVLAGAANQSTLDVDDLATSLRYTGGIAAALKIPIEDVATALALLGNAGIKGSTGGTSLRRILLQLSPDSKEARKELQNLGIITEDGANQFFDSAGKAKDLSVVFQILRDATKNLTDEQRLNAINTIFGARASAAALILMEQAGQGFVDMDAAIAKTSAAEVARERLDNLSGSIRRLKAAVQAYLIDAGSPFQKQLQGMVEGLTKFINKMAEGDSQWGKWIALAGLFLGIFFIIAGAMTLGIGMTLRFVTALAVLGKAFGSVILLATRFASFLALNPILLIIAAIIALGVALFILYKKNEAFHKFVDAAWQKTQAIWDRVTPFLYAIGNAMVWAANAAKDAWDASYPTLKRIAEIIWQVIQVMGSFLKASYDFMVKAADVVVNVAQRIGKAVTDIIDFFRDLPGNVSRFVNMAFDAVVRFFQRLPGYAVQGLTALGQAILTGLAKLPYLFGYAIGFIIGLWIRFEIELAKLVLRIMVNLAQWFWEGLQKLVPFLINTLTELISHAAQFAVDFPGMLLSFLGTLAGLFVQAFLAVTTAVIGWIGDMLAAALRFGVDFSGAILQEIPKLPGQIAGFLAEALLKVGGWVTDMVSLAAELGLRFLQQIWDEFKQLPSQIINAIKSTIDVAHMLFDIGIDIIQGLINGIWSMKDKVFGAVGDVVSGIKDGFKKAFSIGSPSKVMADYGEMIGQGLQNGIDNERKNLVKLVDSMAGDLGRLQNIQNGFNSNMNIGSLLPVQRSNQSPVTVQSGSTVHTTINNPVGQPSEESMFITSQKLAYLGVL